MQNLLLGSLGQANPGHRVDLVRKPPSYSLHLSESLQIPLTPALHTLSASLWQHIHI